MNFNSFEFISTTIPKESYSLLKSNFGRNCLCLYEILRNRCEFIGFYKFSTKDLSTIFGVKTRQINRWLNHLQSLNLIHIQIKNKKYHITIPNVVGRYKPYNDEDNTQAPCPKTNQQSKHNKKYKFTPHKNLTDEQLDLIEDIESQYRNIKASYLDESITFYDVIYNDEEYRFEIRFLVDSTKKPVTFRIHKSSFNFNSIDSCLNQIDDLIGLNKANNDSKLNDIINQSISK